MLHVRTTKTASSATAVQVVRYDGKNTIVVKHIGSAETKADIQLLKEAASHFIREKLTATGQQQLFLSERESPSSKIIQLDKCEYLGVRHTFIYDALTHIASMFGFDKQGNQLLLDLVLMRIIEPSSKLQAIVRLRELFGISHTEITLYRNLKQFASLKENIEEMVVVFAKKHYAFDFTMVFYDVTTLYYESFKEDEDSLDEEGNVVEKGLRRDGFSKDLKFNQPQIVIGLMVNNEGFPVSYEIFEGNTFEGDTFIPSILTFKKRYRVKNLTVVADAAMISFNNVRKLKEYQLKYIVGARLANISPALIKQISKELNLRDGTTGRIPTDKGTLVYDFSLKRYKKDKREMDKQIQKAQWLVEANQEGKRTKFLKRKEAEKDKKELAYELNTSLIEKTELLLGIKGYYTNLTRKKADDKTIIDQYHSLWHVEKAFRIAKSDLQMRPIYHFKRQTIEAHVLICFMALAMCKHMELKTKESTKKIVKLLKSITEARIKNLLTGEIIALKQKMPEEVELLWKTLLARG